MARPIEATPTLYGEDAEAVLRSLSTTCSPEELERRRSEARRFLASMTKPRVSP